MRREVVYGSVVAAGSGLGGMLRHLTGAWLAGGSMPMPDWVAVVVINVIGCALIGWYGAVATDSQRYGTGPVARHFIITGVLAGYTSFSLFGVEAWALLEAGRYTAATGSMAATAALCLGGVWLGYRLGRTHGGAVQAD